eukprot:3463881-Rhodomonas_salina.1
MSCLSWFSTVADAVSTIMVLVAIMLLSLLAPVASSYITPSINSTLAELGIYNTSAIALAAFGISGTTADTYFIDS